MMLSPHVAISGAGPAGLLMAILLSQAGVLVTVLEKSLVADPWTSKSYSINLNDRGLSALDHAGVLHQIQAVGMARHRVILELPNGQQQIIPRNPPNYSLTRPALVECLESILVAQAERVTIQRGVGVTNVVVCADQQQQLQVTLDNGSTLSCTHLIGADGKWSAVRNSFVDWREQFTVQAEPAFGIAMTPQKSPPRWAKDATTVFRAPQGAKYYILASPLPNNQYSISAICYDQVRQDHPWCLPREDQVANLESWEAEYGQDDDGNTETTGDDDHQKFVDQLGAMLQQELPLFFKDINGLETVSTARSHRRTSWLKPLVDQPQYCDSSGRVALIGDAAHAMTPAIGEGCNCALESAVSLKELIVAKQKEQQPLTVDDLTEAFREYGSKRPAEVMPIQAKSAENNRYKVPEASSSRK
ncbi:Kynurenine 3-monooxygenase [Seminavis robusta]|uniref:Kynurenine 3-monooxygenase n=1 Tax=Seminavis robusta TaxID=568900 RepID=A0A9N8EIW1_9STRA|nr:Kynurenine 3-monooxygenase [Seminavis robusta]|eukprot:Sro1151_g246780.1 Kynurenine 3-monooxygenase (417) ;mRNA; r:25738-26988